MKNELRKVKREDWKCTENFLKHIFGNEYDLGLKYLKTLYYHPKNDLPVLVLTSKKRATGKSTFIDYLKKLFGDNAGIISISDLKGPFNDIYADKKVIMIETFFDKNDIFNKIKELSTRKTIVINKKYSIPRIIPFYGKIIIISNAEDRFIKVDDVEIRYWVRKVPEINGNANHNILEDMYSEIPYFLAYLSSLPEIETTKLRMVFNN